MPAPRKSHGSAEGALFIRLYSHVRAQHLTANPDAKRKYSLDTALTRMRMEFPGYEIEYDSAYF